MNRHPMIRLRRNRHLKILHQSCLRRMTRHLSCRLQNFRHRLSRLQKNHRRSILLRLNQHCCPLTNQRRSFRVCFGRNYLVASSCFRVCCWRSFPAWCCWCSIRDRRRCLLGVRVLNSATNLKACSIRRRLGLGLSPRRGGISSIAMVSAWRFSVGFGGGRVPAGGVDGFAALAGGLLDRVLVVHAFEDGQSAAGRAVDDTEVVLLEVWEQRFEAFAQ
jgi:hypothetical protein